MNNDAIRAVEELWTLTVKARALCPYTTDSAIGTTGSISPSWYRSRGAVYFVNFAQPLTPSDIQGLRQVGEFINRSFIVSMSAVLEEHGVVPSGTKPVRTKPCWEHFKLTKWLRNHFAHGDWVYNPQDKKHQKTRKLMEKLLPAGSSEGPGFVTSIDKILEPLKDGVITDIQSPP